MTEPLGQPTAMRHTTATLLLPTDPFGPDPFNELFGVVDLMGGMDEDIPSEQCENMEWLLKLAI